MICVELVALNCQGAFSGLLFRGSVVYDALKGVFDSKVFTFFELQTFDVTVLTSSHNIIKEEYLIIIILSSWISRF